MLTLAACVVAGAFHLLSLHVSYLLLKNRFNHPTVTAIMCFTILVLLIHGVEIFGFGLLYHTLAQATQIGTVTGASSLEDFVYFSAASYTSLGYGDLVPTGGVRIMAAAEALMGLIMIGWTTAYTYAFVRV